MINQKEFFSLNADSVETSSEHFVLCKFINCDFSNAFFYNSSFEDCVFENCNLSNSKIKETKFFDTFFVECKLIGIVWPQSKIPSSFSASKCIFNFNIFSNLDLDSFSFQDCFFKEAFFQECSMRKCNFSGSDFTGTRFENCSLQKAIFENSSNLVIDPEENKVNGAKVPVETGLAMLNKYKLHFTG